LLRGVLIDLGDRGAGNDVMKLIEENQFPQMIDLLVRIACAFEQESE
jgi:hypothetical protein